MGAKISKNQLLSQSVYEYVLDLIMSKELTPGEKISESEIAEKYGISRTPVRDALRQLQNEGVITLFPNRFAQVSEYTEQDIQEVGYMRLALDQLAVRLALRYGSFNDFKELERIASDCLAAYHEGDQRLRTELDAKFHQTLSSISKNSLLDKFQNEINIRVQFILIFYRDEHQNDERHLTQHMDIVDALKQHDEEKLLALVHAHLANFYGLE